jgi:hypothetical protein
MLSAWSPSPFTGETKKVSRNLNAHPGKLVDSERKFSGK